ncbi:MAG: nitronate monooxygenase [Alphaproteobacteria bacterium]|jgi:NAD(P)H-dependent flavin oxidoreductase YrpB (nitropropane dioxygenase family)|nr:nitronate monooxygenase [Alphaproteobacteria bacterium]MDP6254417.1 nitronate monooxygenase [Alphaproteobacteria bacterium]MDP7053814.1 nitronate monooxygenase [Alphaproteobacteria bacterium]MDP7228429.1 nitronate monooxygenase [Alphaproteobacteria bacterium]MDP7459446.1 nitronate monooxygenase [Alphaproteobacteria bacterium]|tara:strand:+ start:1979 stop:3121 length:1143 start_codon:yes stop_codon:yes gene_type:complete
MDSRICDMLGIEFPLVAFTHSRYVVAEVSKAGGFGVLGAANMTPEQLEAELTWIDENINGKPYGVDLIVPNKFIGKGDNTTPDGMIAMLPDAHKSFAEDILQAHDIDAEDIDDAARRETMVFADNLTLEGAKRHLDIAFSHPIKLIANALGVPPREMMEMGKRHGVAVAALVGAKSHAINQVQAGVDILVVAGSEAGGHCGAVSTMVLVPEIFEAIQNQCETPILAAGGIVTGRQMAACMAMGASGVWTGSVWLTTMEAETAPVVKEKMLAASSSDTVRARSRTGKHSRQLRSPWTDAWEQEDAPDPLAMPLQSLISEPALGKVERLSEGGHKGAQDLATYWVGQGVGLMNAGQSVRNVVHDFKEDFLNAHERLSKAVGT